MGRKKIRLKRGERRDRLVGNSMDRRWLISDLGYVGYSMNGRRLPSEPPPDPMIGRRLPSEPPPDPMIGRLHLSDPGGPMIGHRHLSDPGPMIGLLHLSDPEPDPMIGLLDLSDPEPDPMIALLDLSDPEPDPMIGLLRLSDPEPDPMIRRPHLSDPEPNPMIERKSNPTSLFDTKPSDRHGSEPMPLSNPKPAPPSEPTRPCDTRPWERHLSERKPLPVPKSGRFAGPWPLYVYEPKPALVSSYSPEPLSGRRPDPVSRSEPGCVCGSGLGAGVDYSKIELVMRGLRFARDGDHRNGMRAGVSHNGMWFDRNDYYRIYLLNDEFVAELLCEPLFSRQVIYPSVMHLCGSRIYEISDVLMTDVNKIPVSLSLQGETLHFHSGISWIDFNDSDKESLRKWHPIASPKMRELGVEAAVINDKLYCLIHGDRKRPKLGDRTRVSMHHRPRRLSKFVISRKIIPQPRKKRILVLLNDPDSESSTLYAWHPSTNRWYPITTEIDIHTWEDGSPTLVEDDDVILFYNYHRLPYFAAFYLGSNKWVKVQWPSRFPPEAARVKTDQFFYLGNGLVCLPTCRPVFKEDKSPDQLPYHWGTCIHLPVFHFSTRASVDGPFIMFTHLFTKYLDMEHLLDIVDFLPLSR